MNYIEKIYTTIESINFNNNEYSGIDCYNLQKVFKENIESYKKDKNSIEISDLNRIRENIILKELWSSENIINNFDNLRNNLINENSLVNTIDDFMNENIYISIINTIHHHSGNDFKVPKLENQQDWITFILIAKALSDKEDYGDLNSIRCNAKLFNMIYCMSYFKKKNIELKIDERNNITFVNEIDYIKIHDELDIKIKNIGGKNLCEIIFYNIKKFYNYDFNMFLITQTPQNAYVESSILDLKIPYNYILQLCVKNYSKRNYSEKKSISDPNIQYILELAKCYIVLLGVQKFSKFEDLFISCDNLPYVLKSNLIFDRMFTLNQFNYKFMKDTILDMFNSIFIEHKLENKLGFSLNDYIDIMECLISLGKIYPVTINISSVKDKLNKINPQKIDTIIEILSHDKKRINSKFKNIDSKTTFFKKPLIKIKPDYVDLISIPWCSFAFLEALFNEIRNIGLTIDINSYMGNSLEEMIKSRLEIKNIKFKTGYYGQEQCDIVLETDNKIAFIEIKKKSITEEAKRGNDVKFIEDISKSLVSSQYQLLKHEYNLRTNGYLDLAKSNNKKMNRGCSKQRVTLGDKSIIKISLSLTDYGFINSTHLTRKVLEVLSFVKFTPIKEYNSKDVENINDYLEKMQKYVEKLIKITSTEIDIKDIFKDTYFISLNQFLYYLDKSKSIEELLQNISTNNYITSSSNNPYFDYLLCRLYR